MMDGRLFEHLNWYYSCSHATDGHRNSVNEMMSFFFIFMKKMDFRLELQILHFGQMGPVVSVLRLYTICLSLDLTNISLKLKYFPWSERFVFIM